MEDAVWLFAIDIGVFAEGAGEEESIASCEGTSGRVGLSRLVRGVPVDMIVSTD